jgi:hypothetical protein
MRQPYENKRRLAPQLGCVSPHNGSVRAVGFVLLWLGACVIAVAVAWQGVRVVDNEVISPANAALHSPTLAPETEPQRTVTVGSVPTTEPSRLATGPSSTTNVGDPAVVSGETQTLTFELVGGSTAIAFSSISVEAVWARAEVGYTVKTQPEGADGVMVEFVSDGGRSRIVGWWDHGPQWEIRLTSDGG